MAQALSGYVALLFVTDVADVLIRCVERTAKDGCDNKSCAFSHQYRKPFLPFFVSLLCTYSSEMPLCQFLIRDNYSTFVNLLRKCLVRGSNSEDVHTTTRHVYTGTFSVHSSCHPFFRAHVYLVCGRVRQTQVPSCGILFVRLELSIQ
jgi:hypothetical protein